MTHSDSSPHSPETTHVAWLCDYDGSIHRHGVHHRRDIPLAPAGPTHAERLDLAERIRVAFDTPPNERVIQDTWLYAAAMAEQWYVDRAYVISSSETPWCDRSLRPEHLHDEDGVPYDPRVRTCATCGAVS
jgi:hypothetical protein